MQLLSIITSLLASSLLLCTLIFILVKDWRDQINRYFVFLTTSALGILFTMFLAYTFPDSVYITEINRYSQMSTALLFSSVFTMSMVFPKEEKKLPFKNTVLILIPALVISYIAAFTDWTITRAYFENGSIVREYRFGYTIYIIMVFIYLLLGIANFIRKYFKTDVEIYRLQIRYFFVITSFCIFLAAICSIILPRFFNYNKLYVIGASIATFLSIGALLYSIISYNMMNITTVLHRTVMYAIVWALMITPIYFIVRVYNMKLELLANIPSYIFAGMIFLMFVLFYIFVQPVIDRVFKRKQYEFEKILDNFIREIEKIKDFKSIIEQTVDIIYNTLFLKNIFFIMFNYERNRYEVYYIRGEDIDVEPLSRNSILIMWFMRNREILHVGRVYTDDKSFGDIREAFVDFFINNKVKVILPIYHGRGILGLLCLGQKQTHAAYKTDEFIRLQYFQRECNTIISDAHIYEESKREHLVSRTVGLSTDILSKAVPVALPNLMGIKIGAFYVPRHREGMDYFDFICPNKQGVGVIATDISGGGTSSAIYSVLMRSAFHSCAAEALPTFSVMRNLNHIIYDYSDGKGGFITAYYFYYDIRTKRLMYTNAGFPPLEIYEIEKNDFSSCDTEGIPLGHEREASYGMRRISLLRGDIGVIYSRALVESRNQKGEAFELTQLRSIIKECKTRLPFEIAEIIKERFASFMKLSSLNSDILVIVFKVM